MFDCITINRLTFVVKPENTFDIVFVIQKFVQNLNLAIIKDKNNTKNLYGWTIK